MDASCGLQGRGYPDVGRRPSAQRYGWPGAVSPMPQRPKLSRHMSNLDGAMLQVRLARRIRGPVCLATPSGDKGSGAEDVADGRQSGEKGSSPTNGKSPGLNGANTAIRIPLELSALAAETNSPYLEKADRPRWWERAFPKVPFGSLKKIDEELNEPVTIWQKLLPLGLIFFCASFNLTILQSLKDAIMVTTAGAETLPFLASLGVLPASVAFFMFYGRCVERLKPDNVFYIAILPLVLFYAFFASVLYPAAGVLHPHGFYEALAPVLPVGLHGLLKMIENWTFSAFFCVAELWGSVVISVLFWSLANSYCSVSDAKTIYPLMGIAANVALVVSGNYVKWITRSVAQGSMGSSLQLLVASVVGMTALMMTTKAYVDRYIPKPPASDKKASDKSKKKKKKGTLGESFAVLKSSPMISNLALLVVGYGLTHRLFEFCWKGQLRLLYPSAAAYQGVLADVAIWTGYTTIALMLMGRFVFQFFGWRVAALATPAVMLVAGAAFFGLSIFTSIGGSSLVVGTLNLASLGALAGAVTQVFARSSKFSLFDPAKEMVYIEMDADIKGKGKAAVDLLGSQIGKTGASWATQALLLIFGSIRSAMPLVAAVYVGVISAWLVAVNRLALQMKDHESKVEAEGAFVDWIKKQGMQTLRLVGVAVNGIRPRPEEEAVVLSAASASGLEQGVPIVIQHNAAGPVLISNGANGYAGSNGTNGHSVTSGSETASQNVVPSAI